MQGCGVRFRILPVKLGMSEYLGQLCRAVTGAWTVWDRVWPRWNQKEHRSLARWESASLGHSCLSTLGFGEQFTVLLVKLGVSEYLGSRPAILSLILITCLSVAT